MPLIVTAAKANTVTMKPVLVIKYQAALMCVCERVREGKRGREREPNPTDGSNGTKSTANHVLIAVNFLLDSILFWFVSYCFVYWLYQGV